MERARDSSGSIAVSVRDGDLFNMITQVMDRKHALAAVRSEG